MKRTRHDFDVIIDAENAKSRRGVVVRVEEDSTNRLTLISKTSSGEDLSSYEITSAPLFVEGLMDALEQHYGHPVAWTRGVGIHKVKEEARDV